MSDEKVVEALKNAVADEHITCPKCFEIAKAHDVPLEKIGQLCNEQKIKIRSCQLGCF